MVRIKGAEEPVPALRLLGMGERHRGVGRAESNLVGRRWEMSAVQGLVGQREERLRFGEGYGGGEYVCSDEMGQQLHPDAITSRWQKLLSTWGSAT